MPIRTIFESKLLTRGDAPLNFDRLIGVPIGIPDPPIVAVLGVALYALFANACYTGGWMIELLLMQAGVRPRRFAIVGFVIGLVFSVCLTLLPAVVTVISAVVQLAFTRNNV